MIGTDAQDPQKIDPDAPRGTLDHSIMFAIARTLQIGEWHHERTYDIWAEEKEELRALMAKVQTKFAQKWEDAYHSQDPKVQAFGGNMIIELTDGTRLEKEKARANAHCYGDTPWGRDEYTGKFDSLTEGKVSEGERARFLDVVDGLEGLSAEKLSGLTPQADLIELEKPEKSGLFPVMAEDERKRDVA